MQNLCRATITIPKEIHQQARVYAAHCNKSLSKLISDMLGKIIIIPAKPNLPLGKYNLGISKPIKREAIYGNYLRRKISS